MASRGAGPPSWWLAAVVAAAAVALGGGIEVVSSASMRRCVSTPRRPPEPLEDNAPRPPPRPGDLDIASEAKDVLSGADETHLHGKLGLLSDGTRRLLPRPLPEGGLSEQEVDEAHRGFCFNSRAAESVDVERPQPDVRQPACKVRHSEYPCDLPSASVVIVFHNEHFVTLIRSVHSVLNHSPPEHLKEIILVDDFSAADDTRFTHAQWKRLQGELEDYVRALPKTRLVRLGSRRGLMLARMEGIWRATGEVIVGLDSHIEATPGWLEPMLARIREDRRRLVVPSIDGVGTEDFEYTVYGLGLVSFKWGLGQRPLERPDGTVDFANSSVMCGGLFAGDRAWFLHLGGYDDEMRIYGGEEIEIGFRTWQCGGSIEHVPCSHVGHIWRTHLKWSGQVYRVPWEDITRNKLRVAEVWMDEFKSLVHLSMPTLPADVSLGSVEKRAKLREKLGCRPFSWFVDNVAEPDMRFGTEGPGESTAGLLRHVTYGGCVDAGHRPESGKSVSATACHPDYPPGEVSAPLLERQILLMDAEGRMHFVHASEGGEGLCLGSHGDDASVLFVACSAGRGSRWRWRAPVPSRRGIGQLELVAEYGNSNLCLVVASHLDFGLGVEMCNTAGAEQQLWQWEPQLPANQLGDLDLLGGSNEL